MIFFTDITTAASHYCLLHVRAYRSPAKPSKTAVFIDPGVHQLIKHDDYLAIDRLHALADGTVPLAPNEWLSIDYPGDMCPGRMEEFLARTYANNVRYAANPRYIATVQCHLSNCDVPRPRGDWAGTAQGHLSDFASFKYEMGRLFPILRACPAKILAIGNLCRVMYPTHLTDRIVAHLKAHVADIPSRRVHFYGLALRLIKAYVPGLERAELEISVDSTKWTRAATSDLKRAHGLNAHTDTRDLFFTTYMAELKKAGIHVQY